jgi:hypothetical protein
MCRKYGRCSPTYCRWRWQMSSFKFTFEDKFEGEAWNTVRPAGIQVSNWTHLAFSTEIQYSDPHCWKKRQRPRLIAKSQVHDSGIGLPMVNALELTLEWTKGEVIVSSGIGSHTPCFSLDSASVQEGMDLNNAVFTKGGIFQRVRIGDRKW